MLKFCNLIILYPYTIILHFPFYVFFITFLIPRVSLLLLVLHALLHHLRLQRLDYSWIVPALCKRSKTPWGAQQHEAFRLFNVDIADSYSQTAWSQANTVMSQLFQQGLWYRENSITIQEDGINSRPHFPLHLFMVCSVYEAECLSFPSLSCVLHLPFLVPPWDLEKLRSP